MIENYKTEILLSKAKLTKLLFFCVLFVLIGLWIIIKDIQVSNSILNNPILKKVVSYASILMGLLGIYFFTKKLLDKKPGIILNDKGIYDNTSSFNFGLIPWGDISKISEKIIQTSIFLKQRFIVIGVTDPEKYITRETNFLKRKLLISNSKSQGSPIYIVTNGLVTNHKDLLKLVTEYFEKYKK
jgi:hypothetical protein